MPLLFSIQLLAAVVCHLKLCGSDATQLQMTSIRWLRW
jgi:hypothetical protein